MRCFRFAMGIVLVGATFTWAVDGPPKETPAKEDDAQSVAKQIQAVQTEFAEKQQDVIKRYRAAKDDAERQKVLEEFNALRSDLTAQYAKIVDQHPDDEAVFPALQMLINSPEQAAKVMDLLIEHHLDNKQIGTLCLQLGMQGEKSAEKLLRAVAEKSKSDEAKGLALLALGQMLFAQSNEEGATDTDREKLRKQAKQALETVVSKYPDADAFRRKAGDWASAVLFEVEHLAVGLPVPDLAGEDLEGAEFKLSDYRGKVVFLDFWAHW